MSYEHRQKTLTVHFFKTSSWKEPVRDWLKHLTQDEKKIIGEDIKVVEFLWPVGYPSVRKLDNNLWEIRTNLQDGI